MKLLTRGFSLIEILIVVSLLMLLLGIVGFGTSNQIHKAFDTQKKFHLAEFAKSFESFHNDNGCYPLKDQWDRSFCNQTDSFLSGYIKQFYCDPETKEKYVYIPTDTIGNICEGSCGQCYGYKLYATLSNKFDPAIVTNGCNTPLGCGFTDAKGRSVNYGVTSGGMAASELSLVQTEEYADLTREIVFTGLGNGIGSGQNTISVNDRPKAESSVTRRVLVLDFNPILSGTSTLREIKKWQSPTILENKFISDIASASGNFLLYTIVSRIDNINHIPTKEDGYSYSAEEYLRTIQGQLTPHIPDMPIDYGALLAQYDVCDRFNAKAIDEVWIWSGPWFGFWPIVEAGDQARAVSSPPITESSCEGTLPIFSFRYDLDVASMHELYAQRMEQKLAVTFSEYVSQSVEPQTIWGKFTKMHAWFPDSAACGLPFFPPNAPIKNDFSNPAAVLSTCDDWITYPTILEQQSTITCARWGCSKYGYLLWWFSHVPRVAGESRGYLNNWWRYIIEVY